jgi:hypothetical protein
MQIKEVVMAAAGIALLWAGVSAQQESRIKPGPGSGVMNVVGIVDIGNVPVVHATQRGDWQVSLANSPTVRVGSPDFLLKGRRYKVTWAANDQETVDVTDVNGSWVRVGGGRWINLAAARAVEDGVR